MGIITEKDFVKLRKYSIQILREFIRICEKHDIDYFIIAGTAIGVERHGGFIPWDDDLDVGLLREDYDRFMEIAPTEMGSEYGIYAAELNKNIQGLWAQMYIKGTRYVTKKNAKWPLHPGIKIDVCPYDYMPDDDKECRAWYKKFRFWNRLYIIRNTKVPDLDLKGIKLLITKVLCKVAYWGMKIGGPSVDKIMEKCGTIAREHEGKTQWVTFLDDPHPDKWKMSKEEIFPLQEKYFEDVKVKIPNKNHECLTRGYGDYMVPPPKEQRGGHYLTELNFPEE